jgi:ABC-type Fe3+/spermidine/putrescine transport system ATPase subunit
MTTDLVAPATAPDTTAAHIRVSRLHHSYGGAVALGEVSLDVRQGEFLTLLGPSGSGKSSLLHIIAGLVEPTSGTISIAGVDVTHLPTQKREIGLVFQNYALFPHLSAADNIRFPLTVRKSASADPSARVAEVLDMVELGHLADRRPDQLSGGQQQRVAVGRAIAAAPRVLLLDEPLGALDRRLRQQLGRELRRVQQETGITTVYVTHDQEEAFTMSDRVVVMNHGEIRQVGTPEEVYRHPVDAFVADFVGEVNLWEVTEVAPSDAASAHVQLTAGAGFAASTGPSVDPDPSRSRIAVRPERVWVWQPGAEAPRSDVQSVGTGTVTESVFVGNARSVVIESDRAGSVRALLYDGELPRHVGERVAFGWQQADALLVPLDVTA